MYTKTFNWNHNFHVCFLPARLPDTSILQKMNREMPPNSLDYTFVPFTPKPDSTNWMMKKAGLKDLKFWSE